ncbi:hypothetical protein FO519_008633 [Halicephalobus sp. NKZ332]|nr:hypothetical protein FO519_008633 [Halicephalobus sp. NKZ332]
MEITSYYDCNQIDDVEIRRLKGCLHTFERRQEIPLRMFPLFFGDFKKLPTDFRTLSRYCEQIEELVMCFGMDFMNYCLSSFGDGGFSVIYGSKFRFTLTGERNLCPNMKNGVTIEDLSCMLNTTRYIDWNHYQCEALGYPAFFRADWGVIQPQLMLCQLLAVSENCGKNMGKVLCELFVSKQMFDISWPKFDQIEVLWPNFEQMDDTLWNKFEHRCTSYLNSTCQCSESEEFW